MKGVDDVYPLSPMQEAMLFQSIASPKSGNYVEQVVWTLQGEFSEAAFGRAWREVLERHPVLRTAFFWERLERPHQVVRREASVPSTRLDWTDVPESVRASKLADFLEVDRRRGFTLTRAPLLRLTGILLERGLRQFVLTYHHLLLDGWSVALVLRDVSVVYEAVRRGSIPQLPQRRPYRDYIAWLLSQDRADAEAYWRGLLGETAHRWQAAFSERPADARAATGARYVTCRRVWTDSEPVTARARSLGVTVNALVHAVWALVLTRRGDARDVVMGTVVSGRTAPLANLDSMIGLFINTLPLLVSVDSREPVGAVVERTHRRHLELRRFEQVPLKAIQRWTGNALPLELESLVVFDQQRGLAASASTEIVHSSPRTGHRLVLDAYAGPSLAVALTADVDRIERTDAVRVLDHFAMALDRVVADPSALAGAIPSLAPWERHQILVEWNDTTHEPSSRSTLHGLIEAQAARTPHATALVMDEVRVTYAELNGRANRIAHALIARGIGIGAHVGISAKRSIDMVCGLLGALKAGAAYLPVDPEHPTARRQFTIADGRLEVLICDQRDLSEWAEYGVPLMAFDSVAEEWRERPLHNPGRAVPEEEAAYVLYTSGTTGQPKAVLNTHGGIVNRVLAMQRLYHLTASDALLHKTPLGFDVSVWEICWPLIAGARVVVARPGGHRDPEYLADEIVRHGVTVVHFVPSLLRAFLEAPAAARCRTLRDVFSGGEALPPALEEMLFRRLTARLHNLYGPAEAAVDATSWPCPRGRLSGSIPIGRPIDNVQAYVVDSNLQPVPIGVPGELCIAGRGLARGYWARPALTAERFCPNPFSESAGSRLYRTGDRARYRSDGAIEFLGRLDDQVKVRGVRIELGEIEAALRTHPDVLDAAAAVDTRSSLVAYVVPRERRELSRDVLHGWLAARLPMAVRPATFIVVNSLPLNANGKLDRARLSSLAPRHRTQDEHATIRTPAEQTLASIWAKVLKTERIGVHDRLLELGGDSIVALRVVAAAADAGLRVSLRDVFERTLGEIAACAVAIADLEVGDVESLEEFPLTPTQRTLFEEGGVDRHHFNQSLALELVDPAEAADLAQAAARLQTRHAALRLRFRRKDGEWVQFHAPPSTPAPFCRLDLSELSPAGRQSALAELQGSLDLERGPVWRLVQGEDGRLLMIVHHLAVDIVSWSVLIEDFCRAMTMTPDTGIGWPRATASYRTWALALARGDSARIDSERAFWLEQLAGPASRLRRDFPSGLNVEGSVQLVEVELSENDSARLTCLNRRVEPLLLAALTQTLATELLPGGESLVIDLESHGRGPEPDAPDVSRTVGWFTAIFPFRLPGTVRNGGAALLEEIERRRAAVPHSGHGYGVLRHRAGAAVPESPAEILFNYLGALDPTQSATRIRVLDRPTGPVRSPRARRGYVLEINGGIFDGRLRLVWSFSEQLHRRERIEQLARTMTDEVRAILAGMESVASDTVEHSWTWAPPESASPAHAASSVRVTSAELSDREMERLAESLARSRGATSA